MEPVYIFGHKSPDTDSVCSAIAYAYLKNTRAEGHIAARLGDVNRETLFVLNAFGLPKPPYLTHVYIRARDIMTTNVVTASSDSTVFEIGELMHRHKVHAIPIVDAGGRVQGVVTEHGLARSYLEELRMQSLHDTPTELGKIAHTLQGRLLLGEPDTHVQGRVWIGAMSPASMMGYISAGDLLILGDRENAQEAALNGNISCLILTGDFEPSPRIRDLARAQNAAIIVTPFDTFAAGRLINLSVSALRLLERDALIVGPESVAQDITPDLLASKTAIALVQDTDDRLAGVLTKTDLVGRRKHRVILVDHSERSQSADGIEKAEILEILDHHRLGGLETAGPILALIAPVGCTATLVLRRYREFGVAPPRPMAGMMVAAILSDTMLLKSPTTTSEDEAAIRYLGEFLGEDPLAFGVRMYNAKFDLAGLSPAGIVANDLKKFAFGNARVGIGQIEVADMAPILARKDELLTALAEQREKAGFDLILLMVSDIMAGGTELIAAGNTRVVERAFGKTLHDSSVYLPGVLSRKLQVVPVLSNAL